MRRRPRNIRAWLTSALLAWGMAAAEVDVNRLPAAASSSVDFDQQIRPIFERSCLRCHGPERPKNGFRLDDHEAALKGGKSGPSIIVGQGDRSPLVHYVARLVEDMEMPPAGKGEPLTQDEIALLRAWIDQGAKWSTAPAAPTWGVQLTPTVQWISVSGNAQRFREHWWMDDGWSGGFERFSWEERLNERDRAKVNGRVLFGGDDYDLNLTLERKDLGAVRAGFRQYRHYYDTLGGSYAPFQIGPFEIPRDLHVDIGKAWIELQLSKPDWPQMVLGYEYHYRDGDKSSLSWGSVFDANGNGRAIYPTVKAVDEALHLLRFDLSKEGPTWWVEDNLRVEFYDLATERTTVDTYTLGSPLPDSITLTRENYDHFQAANAIRLSKQLRDWWQLSGGYLYSYLDGDGGFNQEIWLPTNPALSPIVGDSVTQLLLEQRSHYFNVGTMLGPWEGLTLGAGVQNEWTSQRGARTGQLAGVSPVITSANLDKASMEENLNLRYTALPYTVLFGEAKFRQERFDHFENNAVDDLVADGQDFLRDTDATTDGQDYRAGFALSPWQPVNLQASYRFRVRENHYDHLTDKDGSILPGNGYPAFILARETSGDEVEVKLAWRALSWLKTTLKYQWVSTDYEGTLFGSTDEADPTHLYPGGALQSGQYDAHIYSANVTLSPWKRLYLNGTVSYSTTATASALDAQGAVVPYEGDVLSAMGSATYVLDLNTDLQLSYAFSRADYRQDNELQGLPLGIDYDRHGLMAGIIHRWSKNLSSKLQYGFYRYDEPASQGAADYVAHGVFASLSWVLP